MSDPGPTEPPPKSTGNISEDSTRPGSNDAADVATIARTPPHARDDETRPQIPAPRRSAHRSEADLTLTYVVGRDGQSGTGHPVIDSRLEASFRPGGLLQDRYVLEDELGRGGMGLVYLGRDRRLDRPVAVKIILPRTQDGGYEDRLRDSFAEEARIGASLTHPAIATVFDYGFHGDAPFTVFEYIAGETLRELIRRRGKLEVDEVRSIVGTLAQALDFAHSRRVVHRDLKPENVRATEQGLFKILDLGLAKDFQRQEDWTFCGTPAYASPEQAEAKPCDGRTDQYALAVMAYEMLTGRRPFEARDWRSLLEMHASAPVPQLTTLRPDLTDAIGRAVVRALAKDPNDRYATCEEFAVALGCQFLSVPPSLPEVIREADLRGMKGRLRTIRMSFSLARPKIHLVLTPESLWVWYHSAVTRVPLAAISAVTRRRWGKVLRLKINGARGPKAQRFIFRKRRDCREWCETLSALVAKMPADQAAAIEPPRVEPVMLLAQRPVARFQLLGPIEARGRKRWSVRAGLQIRGVMSGADAVSDVREERLAGFVRTEKRVAGTMLRAVDGDGRAEIKLRWFDAEAARIGVWMVALMSVMLAGAGVFVLGTLAGAVLNPVGAQPTLLQSPAMAWFLQVLWPFLIAMGFYALRWPQLARPAGLAFFGLGIRSAIGILAVILSAALSLSSLARLMWNGGAAPAVSQSLAILGVAGLVSLFVIPIELGYAYTLIFLGRRAWRSEQELRRAAPDAPARAPRPRKLLGAASLAASAVFAAWYVGTAAWVFAQSVGLSVAAMSNPAPSPAGPVPLASAPAPSRPGASSRLSTLRSLVRLRELIDKNVGASPDSKAKLALALNDLSWALLTDPDASARDPKEALALAARSTDLDSTNWMSWNTRALAEIRAGRHADALKSLDLADRSGGRDDPANAVLYVLACSLSGDRPKAAEALERTKRLNLRSPRNDPAFRELLQEAERSVKYARGASNPPG